MVKDLWKGVFDMPRTTYIQYAAAYSAKQAKVIMARQIAKKQDVLPVAVLSYLKEHPSCYVIKKEIEWEEVDNADQDQQV